MQQHDEPIIDGSLVLTADHGLEDIKIVAPDICLNLQFAFAASKPNFFTGHEWHP
jgi:hypothetical protein